MSLKTEMICHVCKLYLKNPISLPCGCFVCGEHMHDGYIQCLACNKEFQIPSDGLTISKTIASILAKELHLSEEEKLVKKSIQGLIEQLEQLQNELSIKQKALELNSHAHFAEIRRQIDIHREELKAKIDEIALKMIDLTNKTETAYTAKLDKMSQIPQIDTQACTQTMLSHFRKPDLILDEVTRLQKEHESEIKVFKTKLIDFESLNNEIKSLGFKKNQEFQMESFGILKLNESKNLISCSIDTSVKIWDLETKECISTLEGHIEGVRCVVVIENDKIVSGSYDGFIKIWDARENVCLKTFNGHKGAVWCLKTLSTNTFASGSNSEIKIWNIYGVTCLKTLEDHVNTIFELICLPDRTLVSCSRDHCIKFWDLNQGTCLKTLKHSSPIHCLLLLPNGHLASGSKDKTIQIWNIYNGECVKTLQSHSSYVWRLNSLESGELISCSDDSTIKIWDLESAVCIRTLVGHSQIVRAIKVGPNNTLISGSTDGTIKTWNPKTGECLSTIDGHSGMGVEDLFLI